MFERLLEYAENNLHILDAKNANSQYTQFVIGEMHFHPKVQSEVLKTLLDLRDMGISFFGKEGLAVIKRKDISGADLLEAISNHGYMRDALKDGINAGIFLASVCEDIAFEGVDDLEVRKMTRIIDSKCYDLFLLKKRVGWERMSAQEKNDYELWFSLLKHVLLLQRSNLFVNNLLRMQKGYGRKNAALICGAGHTPLIKEHTPYSVLNALESTGINYIIAVPYTVRDLLEHREPFDFYSKSDKSEVSPYEN